MHFNSKHKWSRLGLLRSISPASTTSLALPPSLASSGCVRSWRARASSNATPACRFAPLRGMPSPRIVDTKVVSTANWAPAMTSSGFSVQHGRPTTFGSGEPPLSQTKKKVPAPKQKNWFWRPKKCGARAPKKKERKKSRCINQLFCWMAGRMGEREEGSARQVAQNPPVSRRTVHRRTSGAAERVV